MQGDDNGYFKGEFRYMDEEGKIKTGASYSFRSRDTGLDDYSIRIFGRTCYADCADIVVGCFKNQHGSPIEHEHRMIMKHFAKELHGCLKISNIKAGGTR